MHFTTDELNRFRAIWKNLFNEELSEEEAREEATDVMTFMQGLARAARINALREAGLLPDETSHGRMEDTHLPS